MKSLASGACPIRDRLPELMYRRPTPMSRSWKHLLTAPLALLLLFACTPEFPSDATIPDRMCNAMCARHVQCQPSKWTDAQCRASCLDDPGRRPKFGGRERVYWREDYVDAIVHCTEAASCDVLEDEPLYRSQCFGDTLPAPSPLAQRACTALNAKYKECGGARPSERCVEQFSGIRDDVLKSAVTCLTDQGCRWGVECWNDWAKKTL